jgi:hypothetical protein
MVYDGIERMDFFVYRMWNVTPIRDDKYSVFDKNLPLKFQLLSTFSFVFE